MVDFINTLQDCFLYQHVTEPTRHRDNEPSNLLDLILSSEEGMVKDLSYHPPLGESDHVVLKFDVSLGQVKQETPPSRNIYKANYDLIKSDLNDREWDELLTYSFEDDYKFFFDILRNLLDKYTPFKAKQVRKKNIYMTSKAMRLKNKKRRLWKRYITSKSNYDRQNYIRCKNDLRTMTRNLRSDFESKLAKTVKSKPKDFWRYVKSRLKSTPTIPSLTKPDGSKASTSKEKTQVLNDYFTSVFTRENLEYIPEISTYGVNDQLSYIEITPEIVRVKLGNLNPNKSPGYDLWHPYFLKELAGVIYKPLSILFKKSLKEGAHSSWIRASITAVYKKGLKSEPGNYRPISMTSVISKTMESIILDAIVVHLIKNEILSDDQHGFVPGRDCMTQLLLCMEEWTSMVEEGKTFDINYSDFSKAFDSVAHERLLRKLVNVGLNGHLLHWIRTFLTCR